MTAAATIMTMLFKTVMQSMRTAMSFVTCMIRMDISTRQSAHESNHKTPFACSAGMNAETYDTEAVP
jgi:hypothetical protein